MFLFFKCYLISVLRPWLEASQFPGFEQLIVCIVTTSLMGLSNSRSLYISLDHSGARYQKTRDNFYVLKAAKIIHISQPTRESVKPMQPHQACHILPHIAPACCPVSPGTTSGVALPGSSLFFGIISDKVLSFSSECHCVVLSKENVKFI